VATFSFQKTTGSSTINVRVPHDVKYQRHIADILSTYDDLIENNTRRMKLLEKAARLVYEEWFAQMQFPGREHTRIIAGVPEGWRHTNMNDVCDSIGGGTPSTKRAEYWGGDITWLVPTDVTRNDCLFLIDSERKITEAGLRESSATRLPPETILMTSRASVGFFVLVDQSVCTNQGFINIVPNTPELRMYAAGRSNIHWIVRNARLTPNVLLHLPRETVDRIMNMRSGQQRINEIFRVAQGQIIGRGVIATLGQQEDYMKRVRGNGGSRSQLQPEGIVILGHFDEHRRIAQDLNLPVPERGELLSVRLVRAKRTDSDVTLIDGDYWRLAVPEDPVTPAPNCPHH
jgi:hypothetical protein